MLMPMPREQPSVGSEPAAGLLGAFANYMDTSGAKAAAKPAAEMTLAELSRGIRGIIRAPFYYINNTTSASTCQQKHV